MWRAVIELLLLLISRTLYVRCGNVTVSARHVHVRHLSALRKRVLSIGSPRESTLGQTD